jgi:hypothetical protein
VLPEGIHKLSFTEFTALFVTNPTRRQQFRGLLRALQNLKHAGCSIVYIDGSYVTGKPEPGDYDACWDPTDVNQHELDPVFLDFSESRKKQKQKYYGEFIPSTFTESATGRSFFEFFQVEKFTGEKKGIVVIDLEEEDLEVLEEEWR